MPNATNVFGKPLMLCCGNTGFTREGFCYVPESDIGNHSVCAIMTHDFLQFSYSRGNNLITPVPEYSFPGLKAGDKWCLCASRWWEAYQAGVAPLVDLNATHVKALDIIPLAILEQYAAEPHQV
ncbi:DUF2237 domain-containing protein [Alteromonas sediminis]|uniref:DUF2237 domain-containing protein n=1 Tax=Alteromonas sediminis TaxID=2259342 RepID=A0A3N5XZ17_9ALTE|nr:DUF2237 domain-containing protein [Alteromonas sediminis]RPJ65246.1 DUF2237 domain-containing protein [Alteromonas sediminis]